VSEAAAPALRRTLTLWDLIFYGMVLIQPTAPAGIFGVVSEKAKGHVVTTILIGMFAMLLTARSYGRMARVYPSAGSAYTYVGQSIHPALGYVTGWSMVMDYVLNPTICTILCAQLTRNYLPWLPRWVGIVLFAVLFTALNLRGIKSSARTNQIICIGLGVIVLIFLGACGYHLFGAPPDAAALARPFYDPATFSWGLVLGGTSIACLTYIGFDGISTLSEEVENPRRNIMLATVLTCLLIGVLAALQVYGAQLVWGGFTGFPNVDTAFVHVAGKAGGPVVFAIVNAALLLANIGSGSGAQLGAARLLYGMGRSNALPKRFFGFVDARTRVPRNNVLLVGALALVGGLLLDFGLGAEMLNFGAFIAFMGVNLATFSHYWAKGHERSWANFVLPLAGFAVCVALWLYLSPLAKWAGGAWLLVGIVYGAIKTRGFTGTLVSFDAPPEEEPAAVR
jgi:amino acid transporter